MCRCCQTCWENFKWYCFEERFCYDESIANYNPEEDEEYLAAQNKNGNILAARIQPAGYNNNNNNNSNTNTNNHTLTVPNAICEQPRVGSGLMNAKIHEEDFRRETQTNVPMLGPEILAVFANSQIFQDHQPTKLNRINTKTSFLSPSIHMTPTPHHDAAPASSLMRPFVSDQERLLQRLEGKLNMDATDASAPKDLAAAAENRITFTLSADSSPEGSQILATQKFEVIAEEEDDDCGRSDKDNAEHDGVILRPRLISRHAHLLSNAGYISPMKRPLRTTKSVPHFNVRSTASETDIFAIASGNCSSSQISMTPEVPSISFSNLPKNYEDTPTIEKYRVSQSLYSIQTANAAARATQYDYSMPRYFRYANNLAQSADALNSNAAAVGSQSSSLTLSSSMSTSTSRDDFHRPEKSKRLQRLRENLPPLLIHSVSFKRGRDEAKRVN